MSSKYNIYNNTNPNGYPPNTANSASAGNQPEAVEHIRRELIKHGKLKESEPVDNLFTPTPCCNNPDNKRDDMTNEEKGEQLNKNMTTQLQAERNNLIAYHERDQRRITQEYKDRQNS